MYAVEKIKMKTNCRDYNNLQEIDLLYIAENWYKKERVHDWIKNGIRFYVNQYPYPLLQAKLSMRGEKYVCSKPNKYEIDNLLSLPREN